MSRMWTGFVSKVLKIGAFYILRLQKTSETHQLNVKSMPFSKLFGNESAHIGNSALTASCFTALEPNICTSSHTSTGFQTTGCSKQKVASACYRVLFLRVNWRLKYFAHLSLYMSRMWAGFVSKVLKIGTLYILRLQDASETHQLNVKSMPFSKLLGNESAHIGNSALTASCFTDLEPKICTSSHTSTGFQTTGRSKQKVASAYYRV